MHNNRRLISVSIKIVIAFSKSYTFLHHNFVFTCDNAKKTTAFTR